MHAKSLALLTTALLAGPASAGQVLFADNFNAPETVNLDTAPLAGRLGGSLAAAVKLQSRASQIQTIAGNMWRIQRTAGEGRLRFHNVSDLTRFNWAAGTTGAAILADGGLKLEFDWLPLTVTDTNWIEVSFGLAAATDPAQTVNEAQTDLGILFRHNGTNVQYFDNSVVTNSIAFPATFNRRHVVLEYALTSFADASSVTGNAWVNGTQVMTNKVFDLNNNAGALYFEIGSHVASDLIDNLKVSTLGAGPDTDSDTLPDQWETEMAGNLTDLTNVIGTPGTAGGGDFDNDGLSDVQEYTQGRRTFPGLHPQLADSDADGLSDGAELTPVAPRVATDPTLADSDGDGLSDNAENKTGDYVDASNSGTDPVVIDTDGDNFPDGVEANSGGNPMSAAAYPVLPSGIAISAITDDVSTGISATETYTHKISGGAAATVNGVALDALTGAATPANFTWETLAGSKSTTSGGVTPAAATGWTPATGNVTGAGNLAMLTTLTFSGTGDRPFTTQRYTFSSLEPGRPYEFRYYTRMWSTTTVRPIALKFINGGDTKNVFTLLDRPGVMTGTGNDHTAYYLSCSYIASGTSMIIEAQVPRTLTASGSFHMYGMTNRISGPPTDSDMDGISDYYENTRTGGLTALGAEPADADSDGLTDVQEYTLSINLPALNPTDADSDDDGLNDGPEINGAGSRPPTSPVLADTDADGLSDLAETNTGNFVGPASTGSNPTLRDTDSDSFEDAAEVAGGTDVNLSSSRPALPPGVALSVLTDDASTGIDSANTYTHKVSGGRAVTINGVALDLLSDTVTPANFAWDTGPLLKSNYITLPGLNNWVPATGNVTGSGLLDLLTAFTYSGNGANAGSTQKFTLSGLTPGLQYEFKLYTRAWDQGGSGRPIDITFTNGVETAQIWPGHYLLTDRPGGTTTTGNNHVAYALTFTYVAQGSTLVIDANVPAGAVAASGSFHMYGLTNRVAAPPAPLDFTSIQRAADGSSMTLTWNSLPSRAYKVEFSTDLATWIELTDAHPSGGLSTTYVDSVASNLPRAQYRITIVP